MQHLVRVLPETTAPCVRLVESFLEMLAQDKRGSHGHVRVSDDHTSGTLPSRVRPIVSDGTRCLHMFVIYERVDTGVARHDSSKTGVVHFRWYISHLIHLITAALCLVARTGLLHLVHTPSAALDTRQ